jgi:hypothetical protein
VGASADTSEDISAVGRVLPDAQVSMLPAGTLFLLLQYPELMVEELRVPARRSAR